MPGVEKSDSSSALYTMTSPLTWGVDGVDRNDAHLVSYIDGTPAYGGTPSDQTIVQIIQNLNYILL